MWWWFALVACTSDPASDPIGDEVSLEVPWTEPGQPGPFAPGVTYLPVDDPRGDTLHLEVWYPADPVDDDAPDPYIGMPITLGGYRNARPERDYGPWPLLAFSHGFGGVRYQSATLMEHLASHGYVVVSPDHDGTVLLDIDWDDMDQHLLERPDDVRFAVDEVLRRSASDDMLLGGMVADEHYVVLGHSFGSVTSLALGGAALDFEVLDTVCATEDLDGCGYLPEVDPADLADHGMVDERIDAMVLMSPGGWYAFGEDGANLADTVPSLVLAGDRDGVLPYEPEQRPTWERLGAPSDLGTYADAGHYAAFSDMCTILPVFADCTGPDEGYLDAETGQAITEHVVTAWIGAHWRGDARDAEALEADVLADFAALTWETRD